MPTRQTTIRFPERTDQQLEELAELFGDKTKVVVVAIDRLYQTEMRGREMETDDRVTQVNWLFELAGNVAQNLAGSDDVTSAEELVEYALSDEGRESWGIEIPSWFDNHDRSLLVDRVTQNLGD